MIYALHFARFLSILCASPETTMKTQTANKAIKVDKNTYRVGKWLVSIEKSSQTKWACGVAKKTTWTTWSAMNTETFAIADNKSGNGGIKEAAMKLS